MNLVGILDGRSARALSGPGDLEQDHQLPPSPERSLILTVATGGAPVLRGEALAQLDTLTGDRATTDRLVRDVAAPPDGTNYIDRADATAGATTRPITLTSAEKRDRLETALPMVIANVKAAVGSGLLTPAESADLQSAAKALERPDTKFVYRSDPAHPTIGALAAAMDGHSTIAINLNATGLFKPDGSVSMTTISAFLAHEGRHVFDARAYGEPDGPRTLEAERRTERNAYRTEAAYLKATGGTMLTTDPETKGLVPLTASTANFAAEASVQRWVSDTAKEAFRTNAAIDRSYAAYVSKVALYDRTYGTHTTPTPRQAHVFVPSYRPPSSY